MIPTMRSFICRSRVTRLFILSALLLSLASAAQLFAQQYPPPPGSYPGGPPSGQQYPPQPNSPYPPPPGARPYPPPQPEVSPDDEPHGPGTSAGGKWMMYSSEDRMTAQKRTRFELLANDSSDADSRAKVILFCADGELKLADFRPNTNIAGPNRISFWARPQMEVRVRANDRPSTHSWNWVNGSFLSMDKGSTREMMGSNLFRIEFTTPNGPEIAEFSPAGLDVGRVKSACGLTPKRP